MANNRVYLVCKVCGSKRDAFYLGKWYPSMGWFRTADSNHDAWLWMHNECALVTEDGECFELRYDMNTPGAPASLFPEYDAKRQAKKKS